MGGQSTSFYGLVIDRSYSYVQWNIVFRLDTTFKADMAQSSASSV